MESFSLSNRTAAGWLSIVIGFVAQASADDAFFRERVAPIFERHCVRCHNDGEGKGGLSLATREAARKGGDGGPVILEGKSHESSLVQAVSGDIWTIDNVTFTSSSASVPVPAPFALLALGLIGSNFCYEASGSEASGARKSSGASDRTKQLVGGG